MIHENLLARNNQNYIASYTRKTALGQFDPSLYSRSLWSRVEVN